MTNEERIELIHNEANIAYSSLIQSMNPSFPDLPNRYVMPTMSFLTFEILIDRQVHSIVDWNVTKFKKYSIWASYAAPAAAAVPVGLTVAGYLARRYVYIGRMIYSRHHNSVIEPYILALDPSIPLGKVKINVWCPEKNKFIEWID